MDDHSAKPSTLAKTNPPWDSELARTNDALDGSSLQRSRHRRGTGLSALSGAATDPPSAAMNYKLTSPEAEREKQSTHLVKLYHYVFLVLTIVSFTFGMFAAAAGIIFVFKHPEQLMVAIVIEVVSGLGFMFARWCQSKYETFLDRVSVQHYLNIAFSDPKYSDMIESLIKKKTQLSGDFILPTSNKRNGSHEEPATSVHTSKDENKKGTQVVEDSSGAPVPKKQSSITAHTKNISTGDTNSEIIVKYLAKVRTKIESSGEPTPVASRVRIAEWFSEIADEDGKKPEEVIELLLNKGYLGQADPGRLRITWDGRAFIQRMREEDKGKK